MEGEIEAPSAEKNRPCTPAKPSASRPTRRIPSPTPPGAAARLLCVCAPAGQEEFFAQVGVSVRTRRSTPPQLDQEEQAELMKKSQELAPKYRTELLQPQ